ncbi:uncharacterized protein LOC135372661 [Ornithodoros turicata]|uniref:uncharacterized protein LOC135372661 n=1 Tax=Ornithodoros turicata TaxID=34597 RepID=UPI0031396E0A
MASGVKSRVLETLVAGEALISTSLFFFIEYAYTRSVEVTLASIPVSFLRFLLGSSLLGKAIGHLVSYMHAQFHNEATLLCSISIAAVYLTYFIANFFMFGGGTLGVIALGLTIKAYSTSTALSEDAPFLRFWNGYRYSLSVVLAFVASVRVGREIPHLRGYQPIFLPPYFCIVRMGNRVITVAVLFPALRRTGYRLTPKQALVLAWIHLKGTLMLVLTSNRLTTGYTYSKAIRLIFLRTIAVIQLNLILTCTLVKLLKYLGFLNLDDIERSRMQNVMTSLWRTAKRSRREQRMQARFNGADWQWIECHIYLPDRLSEGYELQEEGETMGSGRLYMVPMSPIPNYVDGQKRARITLPASTSVPLEEAVVPLEHLERAYEVTNRNIRRIQTVSFLRQLDTGMVHPETYDTLMTQLQTSLKEDTYLDLATMKKLLHMPQWVFRCTMLTKSALQVPRSASLTPSDTPTTCGPKMSFTERMARSNLNQLLSTLTGAFLGTILLGFCLANTHHPSYLFNSAVITVMGAVVVLLASELVIAYLWGAVGAATADGLRNADLVVFLCLLALFSTASWWASLEEDPPLAINVSFSVFTFLRLYRIWSTRKCLWLLFVHYLHQFVNRRVFRMYDLAVAFITSEDEVLATVKRFIESAQIAEFVREEAVNNKLQLLKDIIVVQQHYPELEGFARSRQVARKILNSSLSALEDLEKSGLVEQQHFDKVHAMLMTKVLSLDKLSGEVQVRDVTTSILYSVPWFPAGKVNSIRKTLSWKYPKGKQMVTSGEPHRAVVIVISGILRIEGRGRGFKSSVLANADSVQHYKAEASFTNFMAAPGCLGVLGFLNRSPSVCDVTCETDIEACVIPMRTLDAIVLRDSSTPCIMYRMWLSVAVRIARTVLERIEEYAAWEDESLTRYVDNGVMPFLGEATFLRLDERVECMILIQGRLTVKKGRRILLGPSHVPGDIREFYLTDDKRTRPLPVLLLLSQTRLQLPGELDWYHQSGEVFRKVLRRTALYSENMTPFPRGSLPESAVLPSSPA